MQEILEKPIARAYLILVAWVISLVLFLVVANSPEVIEATIVALVIILGFLPLRAFICLRRSHANWFTLIGLMISVFSTLFSLVLIAASVVYFIGFYR